MDTISEMTVRGNNRKVMDKTARDVLEIICPAMESGKYITNEGNEASSGPYSASGYLPFYGMAKVYTCVNTVSSISIYDESKTFIKKYNGDETAKWLNIEEPEGRYVRISNRHDILADKNVIYATNVAGISQAFIGAFGEAVAYYHPEMEAGKFITNEGNVGNSGPYSASGFIPFVGRARVYTCCNTSACVAIYDESKHFIGRVNGTDTAEWLDIVSDSGRYIRISNKRSELDDNKVEYIAEITKVIDDLRKETQKDNFLSSFTNIICCGDSLTAGIVYATSDSDVRTAHKPYPDVLQIMTGTPTEKHAAGGATASSWWTQFGSTFSAHHGIYIVFLGTNSGLTDTIDTDCQGTNPANFASTNTGCYGKILQTITNNGDKAVLVHIVRGGGDSLSTTNTVIDKFSAKYSFPAITLDPSERDKEVYHSFPGTAYRNYVHYNDYGYVWLANEINRQINELSDAQKVSIMQTVVS